MSNHVVGSDGSAAVGTPDMFDLDQTNLPLQMVFAKRFMRLHLGMQADILNDFVLPPSFPWKNVLVVPVRYDIAMEESLNMTLKRQAIDVRPSVSLTDICEGEHRPFEVFVIENSMCPSVDTLESAARSPREWANDGRLMLDFRGYLSAFGINYLDTKTYLDTQSTTIFPSSTMKDGCCIGVDWFTESGTCTSAFYIEPVEMNVCNPTAGVRWAIRLKHKSEA